MNKQARIRIDKKLVSENVLWDYIIYLYSGHENPKYNDKARSDLHNAIFLSAGFKDKNCMEYRARIINHDTKFDRELSSFICDVFCCPKCRISLNKDFICGCGYILSDKKLKYNFRNIITGRIKKGKE